MSPGSLASLLQPVRCFARKIVAQPDPGSTVACYCAEKVEVAAGLEPARTGFADQCLDRFGIATTLRTTMLGLSDRCPTEAREPA